jgi:glycosyltransferase involved in cell wall biosynthesis
LARDLGISETIDDLGPQTHDRALALLQGADGALIPLKTTGSVVTRGTIPAKLYEAVALGKPVLLLAEPDGDAARLLEGYPHEFADGGDANAVATAIGRFVRTPSSGEPPCQPPPSLAGWSRTAAATQLDELLRELLPVRVP